MKQLPLPKTRPDGNKNSTIENYLQAFIRYGQDVKAKSFPIFEKAKNVSLS